VHRHRVIRRNGLTILPDTLTRGLALVICGSAVGARSAALGLYYAGPGNKFWQMLADARLTPRRLAAREYKTLNRFGIGLTDLVKSQSGADSTIRFHKQARDRLRERILEFQPRYLCFNGKRAATEFFGTRAVNYGLQSELIGSTAIFVAPSTSGAANGFWNPSFWHQLAELVRAGQPVA
jgi:TDG/mug DNA glycosylase family protein